MEHRTGETNQGIDYEQKRLGKNEVHHVYTTLCREGVYYDQRGSVVEGLWIIEVQSIWGGHRTGLYHMAVWYRTRTQHNIRTRTRIWKSRRFREIHRYLSVQFSTWKMEHSIHQLSWGFSSLYRLLKLTEFGVGIIFIQILKIIHRRILPLCTT